MTSSKWFSTVDTYGSEELRREYLREDAQGRIRLITKFKDALPFEITRLAAEDPDVGVRKCIAKYGQLDYRESRFIDHKLVYDDEHPELNLREFLNNDVDPFVRACLRENPRYKFAIEKWEDIFKKATQMERFALVRNESLDSALTLIRELFDSEDQDLGIDLDERRALIFSFIRSGKVLTLYTQEAGLLGYPESWDDQRDYVANKFLGDLWELASKWPTESGVPFLVYSKVPADDETKAKVYQKCDDPELRKIIISYCSPHEEFPETIGLAKKDTDEKCRSWAETDDHAAWKAEFQSDERILLPTVTVDDPNPEIKSLEQKLILIGKKTLALEERLESMRHQLEDTTKHIRFMIIIAYVFLFVILARLF